MPFNEENYNRLVEELFRRFPSVQQTPFQHAYKPGLERMKAFNAALGYPDRRFRSIHVAGTNGKGSVANMLASALASAGIRTGLFTSPHLLDFRERMRVAAPLELIPREYVYAFLTRWWPWIEENGLSFFEITAGMAFRWFADEKVEAAVVEVGLGGRLDATNILTPVLSLVTTIGLDHCAYLGNTLAEIAAEKAGIFKEGVPALVGETQPETRPVFEEKARDFCPLRFADQGIPRLYSFASMIVSEMDLAAPVQRKKNLKTVLTAVEMLQPLPGFEALQDVPKVMVGIAHTARRMGFHGRWEKLWENPDVICDIGHNPQALAYSFDTLRSYLEKGRYSALYIVYGVMADKDLDAILPLMPREARWFFATPATPRALPAAEILRRFQAAGGTDAAAFDTVPEAVQAAFDRSREAEKPLLFIGGSTFVVADALPLFFRV